MSGPALLPAGLLRLTRLTGRNGLARRPGLTLIRLTLESRRRPARCAGRRPRGSTRRRAGRLPALLSLLRGLRLRVVADRDDGDRGPVGTDLGPDVTHLRGVEPHRHNGVGPARLGLAEQPAHNLVPTVDQRLGHTLELAAEHGFQASAHLRE